MKNWCRGTRTGYQLRSARRSLNIMFQEWGNRGVHLWKVKLAKIPLVEGQAEYSYATDSVKTFLMILIQFY